MSYYKADMALTVQIYNIGGSEKDYSGFHSFKKKPKHRI